MAGYFQEGNFGISLEDFLRHERGINTDKNINTKSSNSFFIIILQFFLSSKQKYQQQYELYKKKASKEEEEAQTTKFHLKKKKRSSFVKFAKCTLLQVEANALCKIVSQAWLNTYVCMACICVWHAVALCL